MRILLLFCVIVAIWPSRPAPLSAQDRPTEAAACAAQVEANMSPLGENRRALWRTLSLFSQPHESGLFRSGSMRSGICTDSLPFLARWATTTRTRPVSAAPAGAQITTNSAYPRSVNDGGGWHGVGVNLAATAGATASWRFLHAVALPEFFWNQNDGFTIRRNTNPGISEFGNPYHLWIDYPTRMGEASLSTASLGQSFLQASWRNLSATLSSENAWIGAADVYPILLSNTAPGFPHLRLGTQRGLDIWIATLEFQLLFGSLSESDYFDGNPDNNDHYFGTTMLVVQPKILPGLFLGVARAVHDSASVGGQGVGFFAERIIQTPFGGIYSGNIDENAFGVILARWVLPASGFEAYAEWSREDTPGGWLDILREPDWTQAYVLGFQKAFRSTDRLIRVYGELNHLGESAPSRAGRGFFSYYTHNIIIQGHTHKGQLLGAAIGPGSDAQLVGVDVFTPSSRSAFMIERTRYDDDTYYRRFARRWGETRHDAEISLKASRTQFIGDVALELGVQYSRRYGRSFLPLDAEGEDLIENNWSTRLGASWQPRF